jgi:hypothetical protein
LLKKLCEWLLALGEEGQTRYLPLTPPGPLEKTKFKKKGNLANINIKKLSQ